jgi:hypothetical protein
LSALLGRFVGGMDAARAAAEILAKWVSSVVKSYDSVRREVICEGRNCAKWSMDDLRRASANQLHRLSDSGALQTSIEGSVRYAGEGTRRDGYVTLTLHELSVHTRRQKTFPPELSDIMVERSPPLLLREPLHLCLQ